jgi:uncharacterized membrane protein YkoI
MKIKALLAILFSTVLVCGLADYANAQSNPERKQTRSQKDDDGEDEKISSQERKRVKITIEQARKIALEKVKGTIIEEELEKENGRLIYSIEIREENKKVQDVEVDAVTGEIVKVELEDEDDEDEDDKPARQT